MKNQQQIDKKFLFKQNKQLRLQLKQAKQLIKLHKQAVLRLSQPHTSSHAVITILCDLVSSTQQSIKINRLNEKILGLESQQMVLEKIVQQTDNDQKQTYHILAEQYNKIKQDNDRLEQQLHKFCQKIGEVDYLSGLVTKYKQVITPTDQALAFKNQQEQLLEFIHMQKIAIRKLTQQKSKLLKINIYTQYLMQHMKQSVQKHKDQVRNMTMILSSPDMMMNISIQNQNQQHNHGSSNASNNILDELNDEYYQDTSTDRAQHQANQSTPKNNMPVLQKNNTNSSILNVSSTRGINTTMNFIKMQRKIIKQQAQDQIQQSDQQSQGEYDCAQINILFPDKVQKIKKDKQITKVPYLNMMKIRQIMAKRDNKLRKQVQAQAKHINPTDKIIKLQTQLQITRKQLTSQTLKFRNMSEQLKNALKFIQELQYRNQLLIQSNSRLQSNYKNIYKDYQITKIVTLRVEKLMSNQQLEQSMHTLEDIHYNSNINFDDKFKYLELGMKKIFGRKVIPTRSQSLGK